MSDFIQDHNNSEDLSQVDTLLLASKFSQNIIRKCSSVCSKTDNLETNIAPELSKASENLIFGCDASRFAHGIKRHDDGYQLHSLPMQCIRDDAKPPEDEDPFHGDWPYW
jgi:hypothetical protein